jgi:hypothetical protein
MTGGKAKGKDEADVKEIERIGIGASDGGMRISVASENFSCMDRKDGIAYLAACGLKGDDVKNLGSGRDGPTCQLTSPGFGRGFHHIPIENHP